MRLVIMGILMFVAMVLGFSQVAAPVEVLDSGVAATNEMGQQLVQGNFVVAYERMNPLWRKRLAAKLGGEEKLKAQCKGIGAQLAQRATTMISYSATGFPTIYEVAPGKEEYLVDGKKMEKLIYQKWLMVIPTVARYRMVGEDGNHVIESKGYQVAVSGKSKLEWSFIDGNTTNLADLRTMFISLPLTMKLPEMSMIRVSK